MIKYKPQEIEPKWQKIWDDQRVFRVREDINKKKFYGLIEFPYPSGDGLHTGHLRSNTAMDIICRKRRMRGYNVLYPIGFDAFGLPTENYAIKKKIKPQEATAKNIATFTKQLKEAGFSFDWSRSFSTTNEEYYKWTQWIFVQMFKHGLAEKKKETINWCTSCKIGLANEEVVNGVCERCGGEVVKKIKEQWVLKITKYADRLIEDLDTVNYLDRIKTQQVNWIGKSVGAEVVFSVIPGNSDINEKSGGIPSVVALPRDDDKLVVFTTRPDTLFGATFMVVAPEHELLTKLKMQITNSKEIEEYIIEAQKKNELERTDLNKEKTGVELKGIKAINPVNNKEIPIFVADYVMMSYGTGAIMAVPAHDERDFEFAHKYSLPVVDVIRPVFGEPHDDEESRRTISAIVYNEKDEKFLLIKWKKFNWIAPVIGGIDGDETPEQAAEREVFEETGYRVRALERLGGEVESHFFADNKNVWRERFDQPVLLELIDENKEELDEAEDVKHEVIWLDRNEAIKQMTHSYNTIGIERFLRKNYAFVDTAFSVMVNSEFLNGLKPSEAIIKMTKWLEEKNIGKKQIQYKLHDWIFSRQRYWGEPIPMVYCEKCAEESELIENAIKKSNKNCIIVHGSNTSEEEAKEEPAENLRHWKPWLKENLEKTGIKTSNELYPNDWMPDYEAWKSVFEKNEINENTILIGHSAGTAFILRWLVENKKKVGKVILLAPSIIKSGKYESDSHLKDFEFDSSLKNYFNDLVVFYSDNDDEYIINSAKKVHETLGGEIIEFHKGHFVFDDMGTNEFPELLNKIIEESNMGEILNYGWHVDENLPIVLPDIDDYLPTDEGDSPLAKVESWIKTKCPVCGGEARRETDVMPNWAGSNWYFIRYTDPKNNKQMVDPERAKYWLPVDWYNGGMEHTTLHLLYSRFVWKFLYDIGAVPKECGVEPYAKRTAHGMILGEGGVKMSKSKGNVINPDEYVKKYGADTLRIYEMFMGPFDQPIAWEDKSVNGMYRFLNRVWNLQEKFNTQTTEHKNGNLEIILNQTIKKVGEDIEEMKFNTAVSQLMILLNELEKQEEISIIHYSLFIILLSPFAPHIAEELWQILGHEKSITFENWPEYDPQLIQADEFELVVQINGKVREKILVPTEISEAEVKKLVLENEKVLRWLNGQEPKKIIYIKGKLVSIVL